MTKNKGMRRILAALSGGLVILAMVLLPPTASTAAGYTEWTDSGPVVTTHENTPPGVDTETERWLAVGTKKHVTKEAKPEGPYVPTDETTVTDNQNTPPPFSSALCRWVPVGEVDDDSEDVPAVPEIPAQHYSLKGNSGIGKDEVPVFPADYWQDNAKQEPNGHYGNHHQPDGSLYVEGESGLHYASHGSQGLRDWFYFQAYVPGKDKVEGKDFKWAKECKTPAVAEESHLDYKWQKQVRSLLPDTPVTETPTPTPTVTETPVVPTETPTEGTCEGVAGSEDVDECLEDEQPTKTPQSQPQPEKPEKPQKPETSSTEIICRDGQWVTVRDGEVIATSGSCDTDSQQYAVTAVEEGL